MRHKIVAGNWKMNNSLSEAKYLIQELNNKLENYNGDIKIIIAPPFTFLNLGIENKNKIEISSQDISANESGAFTGEVSATMVSSLGVKYTLIGHSERRLYHKEDDALLNKKIKLALKNSLTPIFCVGETLNQRKENLHFSVIKEQIKNVLFSFDALEIKDIIIAYEPVWAIGTGETASPEQAQEIHQFIRKVITNQFGEAFANSISILYGGSVKPDNAKDIFSKQDVDGGLVGGACLNANDFFSIINSF
ncbi:MAG: triose-phosphate isomerase [Solirubrobacteraceae bacterium]|jgi:triosephosphate isomerase